MRIGLSGSKAVSIGVSVRVASVRGARGFNHDSIVRQEGIITCKTAKSLFANGLKGLGEILRAEGLTGVR